MCANDLTANFPEWWSKRMQRDSEKKAVFRAIASFEETGQLKIGDTVHRPYGHLLVAKTVGTGGSYARQDIKATDDYLTVDQKKETTFYIEDADVVQSKYPEARRWSKKASLALRLLIDGDVLGEVANAASVLGNFEMGGGGSTGDGIGFTLTTSNILSVFTKGSRLLTRKNADEENRWKVLSPEFRDLLIQFLGGKDSALGDATGISGHIGKFGSFKLLLSNATYWSGRLEFATNPTDADTITIDGVTLTFKATLGTTAGNVHICSDAEKTLNNLIVAIGAPGTAIAEATDTGYVVVSATKDAGDYSDQDRLAFLTATDGATYLGLTAEGRGFIAVSETLTAAADIWTLNKQIQHCIFGQGKPIDLVIQKYPNLGIFHRDGYIGKDFVTWTFYGLKTFEEGKRLLVDVQIRSDGF